MPKRLKLSFASICYTISIRDTMFFLRTFGTLCCYLNKLCVACQVAYHIFKPVRVFQKHCYPKAPVIRLLLVFEKSNVCFGFYIQMIFPWMFDEIHALGPFTEAAHLLAEKEDWPPLYDISRLNNNKVWNSTSCVEDFVVPCILFCWSTSFIFSGYWDHCMWY